jgi:hypothetical protein
MPRAVRAAGSAPDLVLGPASAQGIEGCFDFIVTDDRKQKGETDRYRESGGKHKRQLLPNIETVESVHIRDAAGLRVGIGPVGR